MAWSAPGPFFTSMREPRCLPHMLAGDGGATLPLHAWGQGMRATAPYTMASG
jgi:hypothetical protein